MKQIQETTLLANQSMNASFFSPGVDLARFQSGTIQIILNYGAGTNIGNFAVQISLDNVNWSLLPSSVQYNDSTHTNLSMLFDNIHYRYVRIRYTNVSGSGAACTILTHMVEV